MNKKLYLIIYSLQKFNDNQNIPTYTDDKVFNIVGVGFYISL